MTNMSLSESPWLTNGIRKQSKKKQCLYQKFLKKRKLFESVKKCSKKLHFSRLILKYQNNINKTWNVIKDAILKTKSTQSSFPKKVIHKTKAITDLHLIVKHFNSYFTEIDPNLANKTKKSMNFEDCI